MEKVETKISLIKILIFRERRRRGKKVSHRRLAGWCEENEKHFSLVHSLSLSVYNKLSETESELNV